MTKGILIFAFDNEQNEYSRFAIWSAQRIKKFLDLPVSVVTDNDRITKSSVFDHIIHAKRPQQNGSKAGSWYNRERFRAYERTPYDQTILLDADYVVCSDQLLCLFEVDQSILPMRWAYDCTNRRDFEDLNYFGRNRMPSAWATVLCWRQDRSAAQVFCMMEMIETNWQHYKNIYGFTERMFRNDYALAIAMNTLYGHTGSWPEIPWSLATVTDAIDIVPLSQTHYELRYRDGQQMRKSLISGQDFHLMDKNLMSKLIEH